MRNGPSSPRRRRIATDPTPPMPTRLTRTAILQAYGEKSGYLDPLSCDDRKSRGQGRLQRML
jgi:hypothetical protein